MVFSHVWIIEAYSSYFASFVTHHRFGTTLTRTSDFLRTLPHSGDDCRIFPRFQVSYFDDVLIIVMAVGIQINQIFDCAYAKLTQFFYNLN